MTSKTSMTIEFDHELHQKVTYFGNSIHPLSKAKLFAIIKKDYPNFYLLTDDENVIIHMIDAFDDIYYHTDPLLTFTVKKSELKPEGEL